MNAFEQHGIDHLSASSINLYAAEPAMWALSYLHGYKSPPGAAACRGISAEHGIEHGLFHPDAPVKDCIAMAEAEFDRRMAFSQDPNRQKERDAIPGLVEVGLAELRQYGVPDQVGGDDRQHKIEVTLEGVPVPFWGYLDFEFSTHGIIVDLKTQLRLASEISNAHARQGSIYMAARSNNVDMRFAYVTPKKIGVYQLHADRAREAINEMVQIGKRIEKFLSISTDKAELLGLFAPNYDNFYWNDGRARNAGREVFGY